MEINALDEAPAQLAPRYMASETGTDRSFMSQEIAMRNSRREKWLDLSFRSFSLFIALLVLGTLLAIVVTLAIGASPILHKMGWQFFNGHEWNPVTGEFSATSAIYGTVVTSGTALILAVPFSFGIAFFVTDLCPNRWRGAINGVIELLAGIPSIIYGMWGLFVLAPLLADYVQEPLSHSLAHAPFIGKLFQGPPIGIGLFPAALVLAIMIIPIITSVMREVFSLVPRSLKEAGYGIGATRWEVMWDIVVPYTRVAILGAIILGLGRALGETMAVTFMIGNSNKISSALFDSGNSIASVIANEFAEASDPQHASALVALGLVLFVITFFVLAIARAMIHQVGNR